MLSGKELLDLKNNKARPRNLPSMPPKDFVPTGSAEEAASIEKMVQEQMSFLKDERVEKKNLLSVAEWLPDEGIVKVTHKLGGWESYGTEKHGSTYLNPEEALFLLELSKLQLIYGGSPVSIQQAYQLLLNGKQCTTDQYRAYAHLNRLGYRLLRRTRLLESSKEPPRKKAKMTASPLPSCASYETASSSTSEPRARFQLSVAEESDLNSIPNFGVNEEIRIEFSDANLLPESIRNSRQTCYTIRRDSFSNSVEDDHEPSVVDTKPNRSSARNWAEYKASICDDMSSNPLYSGETKPLLAGWNEGDIYSHLKLISVMEHSADEEDEDDETLEYIYDVYSPGRKFRKSSPGKPCYCLAVTNWNTAFPGPASLERFKKQCGESVIPLIAVTGQNASVAFYQLKDTVSPFSA